MELRDQRRNVNAIEVGKKVGSSSGLNGSAAGEALQKAEAKIAELTAKLKEAGIGG